MDINRAGLELVKEFEGFRSEAYPDPATNGDPWTIGWGHTSAAGPPNVKRGMKITRDEAEAILKRDLEKVGNHVIAKLTRDLNDNQFSALVSFTFNLGPGNFDKSTLLKKVNAGDFAGATLEFARWNKANKKVMEGLTRRRAAEAALFARTAPSAVPGTIPQSDPSLHPSGQENGLSALFRAIIEAIAAIFRRRTP